MTDSTRHQSLPSAPKTAASGSARRKRYVRDSAGAQHLTPLGIRCMALLPDLTLATPAIFATAAGISANAARRVLRPAFDLRLVAITAIPAAMMLDVCGTDADVTAFGSAPNIYTLTRAGWQFLTELGVVDEPRPAKEYGPRNAAFLAHEIQISQTHACLLANARVGSGEALVTFRRGGDAAIDLKATAGRRHVRPDAWFVYQLPSAVLVGLVEVDRGTERSSSGRWQEKLRAYQALFASGHLPTVTGYQNARVLVLTPGETRRDNLAHLVAKHAPSSLAARFWLAEKAVLDSASLRDAVWRKPGHDGLFSLLPSSGAPAPALEPTT